MPIRPTRRAATGISVAVAAALATVGCFPDLPVEPPATTTTTTSTTTTTTIPPLGPVGPSTSSSPYLLSALAGVAPTSVLTVGDSVPGATGGTYKMAGIPDGLGAFDNGDGTMTVLMNHELGGTVGAVRAHGQAGAFVSKWVIRKSDMTVLSGTDLITQQELADGAGGWVAGSSALNRLCSADLPAVNALYNAATGAGTQDRIFLSGEEAGNEGRAFAHVVTGADAGKSFELPRVGNLSFENLLAQPLASDTTSVIVNDDSTPGQVYLYTGTKQTTGNAVEKAGLNNGVLAGIKVAGLATESDTAKISGPTAFTLAGLGDVSGLTGAQIETNSTTAGVTRFNRPEDGVWDPNHPTDYYFATTASFGNATTQGLTRLWRLRFADASNLAAGGTAEIMFEGAPFDPAKTPAEQAGPRMIDNLTIGANGDLLLQEDPGNTPYVAGVYQFDPVSKNIRKVLGHDPDRFVTGAPNFLTVDEESSGVVSVENILGAGKYLVVTQAHYTNADPTLVEGGQLMVVDVPDLP